MSSVLHQEAAAVAAAPIIGLPGWTWMHIKRSLSDVGVATWISPTTTHTPELICCGCARMLFAGILSHRGSCSLMEVHGWWGETASNSVTCEPPAHEFDSALRWPAWKSAPTVRKYWRVSLLHISLEVSCDFWVSTWMTSLPFGSLMGDRLMDAHVQSTY